MKIITQEKTILKIIRLALFCMKIKIIYDIYFKLNHSFFLNIKHHVRKACNYNHKNIAHKKIMYSTASKHISLIGGSYKRKQSTHYVIFDAYKELRLSLKGISCIVF